MFSFINTFLSGVLVCIAPALAQDHLENATGDTLEGHTWDVIDYFDGHNLVKTPDTIKASLSLMSGSLEVSNGCGVASGTYELNGQTLSTKTSVTVFAGYCSDANKKTSTMIDRAMIGWYRFSLRGSTLILSNQSGRPLLVLTEHH